MARPFKFTTTLGGAADDNGIVVAQTLGAAGDFTIGGALASGGVATLDSNGNARQVLITAAGNESARTFTIYGRLCKGGAIVSEAVTGPNATTATSVNHFYSVTRISSDDATAGDVEFGTNGVGSSRWIPMNHRSDNFEFAIQCVVSGTVNYSLQRTYDDIQDRKEIPLAWTDADITGETASQEGTRTEPVRAIRILINSGTGSVETTLIQSGI